MNKRVNVLLGFLIALILIVPATSFAAESTKTISGGQIVDGRTLLPLRSLFESLGAEVNWNAKSNTVIATKGSTKVELTINSKTVKINGTKKTLDVPAKLINGSTMVPVRFVSEALGAKVEWNQKNNYALIRVQGQVIKVLAQDSKAKPFINNTAIRAILKNHPVLGLDIKETDTFKSAMDKISKKYHGELGFSEVTGWHFRTNSISIYSGYDSSENIEEAYDQKLSVLIVRLNDNMTIKNAKKFIPNIDVEFDEYASQYLYPYGFIDGDYKYWLEFTGESSNSQLVEIWIKNL